MDGMILVAGVGVVIALIVVYAVVMVRQARKIDASPSERGSEPPR